MLTPELITGSIIIAIGATLLTIAVAAAIRKWARTRPAAQAYPPPTRLVGHTGNR